MIKLILLVKRKPGTSKESFREHYEAVHAPLATSLIPNLAIYRRNYLTELLTGQKTSEGVNLMGATASGYDCITELCWNSPEDFEQAIMFMSSNAAKALSDDEEKFMDQSSIVMLSVSVEETDLLETLSGKNAS